MRALAICTAVLSFAVGAGASSARAATTDQLEKQIEELRLQIEELSVSHEESRNSAHSFLDDQLTIGGFYEGAVTAIGGPDTPTVASASTHTLGVNLSARFSDRFRFDAQYLLALNFSLLNFENDPNLAASGLPAQRRWGGISTSAVPAQAYVEYVFSDGFRLQGGLGYVPFGVAFQERELVLFIRRGGPQLIRTQSLLSPLWTGINIQGFFPMERARWGYGIYTVTPFEDPNMIGVGGRLWASIPSDRLVLGASTQVGKRFGDTYKALGADFKISFPPFGVTAEYARTILRGEDPWAVYVEPAVSLLGEELLLFTFADFANSPLARATLGATQVAEPYERIELGGGLNWLPTTFTRFRLALYVLNYVGENAVISGQDRDFVAVDLSAGVAF
ncbi:MAG TPA: hypothetical protein VM598_11580 [Bdellovibrionota bacterium]|nr:hypothetical protein [Bdellovibrionota bacterium]